MEHQGTHRSQNRTGNNSRQPDHRFSHNVGHLEHGRSHALSQQTTDLIFPIAGHRKTNHVAAAAHYSSAGCQTGQVQDDAQRCRADGQRQDHAHEYRYYNTHKEGLLLSTPVDDGAKPGHKPGNGRPYQQSHCGTGDNGHKRCHQQVDLRLARHQVTQFNTDNCCNKGSQRLSRTCQYDHTALSDEGACQNLGSIAADHSCRGS